MCNMLILIGHAVKINARSIPHELGSGHFYKCTKNTMSEHFSFFHFLDLVYDPYL